MELKGSRTEACLKAAFANESQASHRYRYFASRAALEGCNEIAALFRATAEADSGHANGHLEYLEAIGDPATELPIGATADNLRAAIKGETQAYQEVYPDMAQIAREEGFDEIADWLETLIRVERLQAERFRQALEHLDQAAQANKGPRAGRLRR